MMFIVYHLSIYAKALNSFYSWFSCDVIIFQNKKYQLCEFLVLSYVRPSKNLTFCNVLARQGSSLCNRVRLNFQVCALRDIKMSD